jgi:polyisoprenoid-binding protein YceI
MKTNRPLFAATLLLTAAFAAHGVEFNQTDLAASSVKFVSKQMNVPVDGSFRKFSAQIKFDPAAPGQASTQLELDLASIDAGSKDANEEVAGKLWFNTKQFPTARFVSSSVKALGGDRYEVSGKMTIKGKTQDVLVPATFTAQGNSGVFDGSFTIRRGDFAIGEGSWAKFDIVANEVQIKFRITATGK